MSCPKEIEEGEVLGNSQTKILSVETSLPNNLEEKETESRKSKEKIINGTDEQKKDKKSESQPKKEKKKERRRSSSSRSHAKKSKKHKHNDDRNSRLEKEQKKEKNKGKDIDIEREKNKEKDTEKEREKNKEKEQKKEKDKNKDKKKENNKDKDKEKDKQKDNDNEKNQDNDKEKDKEGEKPKEKDREKNLEKSKEKEEEKGKEKEKNKEKSKEKDKDKDRHRQHSKDRRKSKEKNKEKDREKDRDRERSSKKKKKSYSRSRSHRKDKKRDKDKSKSKNRSHSRHKISKSDKKNKKDEKRKIIPDLSLKPKSSEEILQEQVLMDSFLKLGQDQHDEARLIEERRQKRKELIEKIKIDSNLESNENKNNGMEMEETLEKIEIIQPSTIKIEEKNETKEDQTENEDNFVERPRKISASKADLEKYKYLKMVDSMREKTMNQPETKEETAEEKEKISKNEKKDKKPVFDMFTDSPIDIEDSLAANPIKRDLLEWDDDEHYYKSQIGELLDKQYQIIAKCGKGVFSTVVRAVNIITKKEVAIKIIRSDEILMRAGQKESAILQKLNDTDKAEKKHVIRYLGSFEFRKHLCLVFEPMDQDLRETLKMFGKKIGLSLEAVRSYGIQIFIALSHLKKNRTIHADIKPDNILCTNSAKTIKLCDFGTAMSVDENSIVEYLVSRYYRAPEIILGYPYDTGIDVWSAACTIYEIYVGNFLFPGRNNNEMIKLILQTKGKFNNKILKRGEFVPKYFDSNYNFLSTEIDPVTKEEYVKAISVPDKPSRDLAYLLNINDGDYNTDKKALQNLKDLLEKCLSLDPAKRMTPEEALKHPFLAQFGSENKYRK